MNQDRTRWIVAGAAALLVVVLLLALFRSPKPPEPVLPAKKAQRVELTALPPNAHGTFAEVTSLADPSPLFLPTKWNASQIDVPLWRPGESFPGFASTLTFATTEIDAASLKLPPAVETPATPAAALARPPVPQPELGLGRAEVASEPFPTRGATLDIVRIDGRPLAESPEVVEAFRKQVAQVMELAKPPGNGGWPPLDFLATVDAAGLRGPLVAEPRHEVAAQPAPTTETDEVARYFQRFLTEKLRIGLRLSPGFYRISVGP